MIDPVYLMCGFGIYSLIGLIFGLYAGTECRYTKGDPAAIGLVAIAWPLVSIMFLFYVLAMTPKTIIRLFHRITQND